MSAPPPADDRRYVNEACLDFLLIEAVDHFHGGCISGPNSGPDAPAGTGAGFSMENEQHREAAYLKLEMMGYRVGQALVERLTRDRPRFGDTLDVVKYVCKDLWTAAFRKQIDNLKTNHKGVYVLTDNNFRWLLRMSTEGGPGDASRKAYPFLAFPCGLVRGALANLGISAAVGAEVALIPQCTFHVKITKS